MKGVGAVEGVGVVVGRGGVEEVVVEVVVEVEEVLAGVEEEVVEVVDVVALGGRMPSREPRKPGMYS